MSDEIKEMNLSEMLFNRDERLLDYITNLQEGYEKADNDRHKLFEQKEKAIEYINSCRWSNGIDKEIQYSLHIPTLLNILQGSDKE